MNLLRIRRSSRRYCLLLCCLISIDAVFATELKIEKTNIQKIQQQSLREDNTRRQLWSLSEKDWARYKTLMQGIRGSISPANISPIEVLGTHARTTRERQKYAETWARMRHDDIVGIIAFQQAYNKAFSTLYPDEQIINTALLETTANTAFKAGDRVLIFIKIEKCASCVDIVSHIMMDEAVKTLPIDIYFIDTHHLTDDQKIRSWAQIHQINRQRLKSGQITLNHDKGTLYGLTKSMINQVPLVYKVNSEGLTQVKY